MFCWCNLHWQKYIKANTTTYGRVSSSKVLSNEGLGLIPLNVHWMDEPPHRYHRIKARFQFSSNFIGHPGIPPTTFQMYSPKVLGSLEFPVPLLFSWLSWSPAWGNLCGYLILVPFRFEEVPGSNLITIFHHGHLEMRRGPILHGRQMDGVQSVELSSHIHESQKYP